MSKPVCAICKEKSSPGQPLYPFPQLLKEMGIEGVLAHPNCVRNEQTIRVEYRRKFGIDMPMLNRRL